MSMEIGQQNINDNNNSTSLVQGVGLANDVPVLDVQAQGLAEIGIRGVGVVNGVFGEANGPAPGQSAGVTGNSDNGVGVNGTSTRGKGVSGTSPNGTGVSGTSPNGIGVDGTSGSGIGINGTSNSGVGVVGLSTSGAGVRATSSSTALEAESTGDVAINATSPTTAIVAQGTTGVVATGADKDGRGVVGRGAVGVQGEGGVGVFGTGRIGVQGAADIGVLGGPPEGPLFSGPPILAGVTGNAPGDVKHGDVPAAYGGWFDALNGTAPLHLEPSADDSPPPVALRGDFFVDNTGRLWFCVAPDTVSASATWKQVQLV